MATTQITSDNFQTVIDRQGITILDFWAQWCGPCRRFAPIFEHASQSYPDIVFGKIDTEANQDLATALEIQSIPTIMVFRDGVLLARQSGLVSEAQLADWIQQARLLDMDEVRKQLEQQQQEQG